MSKLPQPTEKLETIFEMEHRLKKEAKKIAEEWVDVKKIKYLIKR